MEQQTVAFSATILDPLVVDPALEEELGELCKDALFEPELKPEPPPIVRQCCIKPTLPTILEHPYERSELGEAIRDAEGATSRKCLDGLWNVHHLLLSVLQAPELPPSALRRVDYRRAGDRRRVQCTMRSSRSGHSESTGTPLAKCSALNR